MDIYVLTLTHILIFVYWLGGDLGAFYSGLVLADEKRSVPERMLALKILNNIDMAPRTCLILALPTGLLLASAKGWISLSGLTIFLIVAAAMIWLALAWTVHLRHGTGQLVRKIDIRIRWVLFTALFATGVGQILGLVAIPLFIAVKMFLLGSCILMGLIVRVQLKPLFEAIGHLNSTGPSDAVNGAITKVLSQTRGVVVLLWGFLIAAAYLGIATPV